MVVAFEAPDAKALWKEFENEGRHNGLERPSNSHAWGRVRLADEDADPACDQLRRRSRAYVSLGNLPGASGVWIIRRRLRNRIIERRPDICRLKIDHANVR